MKKILLLVASIFAVFGVLAFGATVKAQIVANPINCSDPLQALNWPNCFLVNEKYDYASGLRTASISCTSGINGGSCNAPALAAQISTLDATSLKKIVESLQTYKCADLDSKMYAVCTRVLLLGKSCVDQVRSALTSESSPYSVSNSPITSANQTYGASLQAIAGYKITSNTGTFTLKSARFDFNGAMWPYVKSIYIYDDLIRLASITDISQSNFEQVPGGLRLMMPFNEADARVRMGESKTLTVVVEPRAGKGSFDNGMTMPINGFRVTDDSGLSQYAPAYVLPYQVFTINKAKEDISKSVELRFLGGMMAKRDNSNPADSDSADGSITFSLKALDRDIYINKSGYISGKYDSNGVVAYTDIITGDLGGEVFDDPKTKFTYSCQGCDMYDVNRYIIRQGRTATFVVRGIIYPKIGTVNNSNNYYMGLSRLSLTDDPFQTIGENVYFGEGVPNAYHTNSVYLNYRAQASAKLILDSWPGNKDASFYVSPDSRVGYLPLGSIVLKAQNGSVNLTGIRFKLEALDKDNKVKDVSGIVDGLELYDGEMSLGAIFSSASEYTFSDIKKFIGKDTKLVLSVKGLVKKLGGSFAEGDQLRFTLAPSDVWGLSGNDSSHLTASLESSSTGSIFSAYSHLFNAYPEVSIVSQNIVKKDNANLSGGTSDAADGTIIFDVKAVLGDIYINTAVQTPKAIDVGISTTSGDPADPASTYTYSCVSGCDVTGTSPNISYVIRNGRTGRFVVNSLIYPKSNSYYYSFVKTINWSSSLNGPTFAQTWPYLATTFKTNATYLVYRGTPAQQDLSKSVELKYLNSNIVKIDKAGSNPPASDMGDGTITFSVKALDRDIYVNLPTQKVRGVEAYAHSQKGETSDSKTSFTYSCQNCDIYSADKYIIRQGQTVNFAVKGLIYPAYSTYYYLGLAYIRVSATPTGDGQSISFGPGIPNNFHTDSLYLARREVSGGIGQNPDIVTLPWSGSDYKMSGAVSLNNLSSTGAYVGFVKYTMVMGPGAAMKGETVYWPYPGAVLKKQGDVQTFDIAVSKPSAPTLLCYDAFVRYGSYYKKANMQQCTVIR